MRKKDIRDLVERAIQNDSAAFSQLCEATAKDVLYMCTKIMGHRQDGEDAAQETYIKMQKGICKLQNPDVFHVWINRVMISACNDVRRKKMRINSDEPIENHMENLMEENKEFLPLEYAENIGKRETLLSAIDKLPDKYRQVIVLFYYEELPQKDIAQVLDISVSAVDHRLRSARSSIKKALEGDGKDLASKKEMYGYAAVVPVATTAMHYQADKVFTPKVVANFLKGAGFTGSTAGTAGGAALYKTLMGISITCGAFIATLAVASTAQAKLPNSKLPVSSTAAIESLSEMAPQLADSVPAPSVPNSSSAGSIAAVEDLDIILPERNNPPSSTAAVSVSSTQPAPPASSAPAPASSKPPVVQPSAAMVEVKGQVGFKNAQGNALTSVSAGGLPFCTIRLWQGGKVVGRTMSRADGAYEMYVSVKKEQKYKVEVVAPQGYVYTEDNPEGLIPITLTNTQKKVELPVQYLTDTAAPKMEFAFYNTSGTRTRSNPSRALIIINDATDVECQWVLLDAAGNQLGSGAGKELVIPADKMMQPGGNRAFTLYATSTDAAGNKAEIKQVFFYVQPSS